MTRVIVGPIASIELDDAANAYDHTRPGLGLDFLNEIQRCLDGLRAHPYLAAPMTHDLRRSVLRRFPYFIVYRVVDDTVQILAILPSRAGPDRLTERLQYHHTD